MSSSNNIVEIDSVDDDLTDEDNYEEDENYDENSDLEIIEGPSDTVALNTTARQHLREIYNILEMRQEVNYKNALEMNQEMLRRLQDVRDQITALQAKVAERFAANEEFLKENMKRKRFLSKHQVFGKINCGEKFYIKGSIYFKDFNKRNAPNNDDYLERQKSGEMFPMDCELTSRHVWSITDKTSIIKAIKEQIYEDKTLRKRFKNKNQKLEDMLKVCEKTLKIDWVQISVHNLKHRHTPTSCKAMFEVYLHPKLKHDAFTEEENELLAQAAEKFNLQNWAAIAAEVGRRSDYQCFIHYHTTPSFRAPYERWDKSTDELLLKSVEASKCNGIINWSQIAYLFPYKSRTSLQQRYHYFLNPTISHAPFTGEEDLLLLAAVKEYGTNFAKFPRSLFPNRTVIQIRSRYFNTLETRHKACPWTLEDDRILLKFVEENGMLWKQCSEFMDHRHTRTSCRQRYVVIQKNFQKNPHFKLEDLTRRSFRMMSSSVTTENWLHKIEELRANPTLTVEEMTAPIKKRKLRKRQLALLEAREPPEKRPRSSKKPIYIERLRSCGILYHNFFKYAYNFRFGKPTQYTPAELYTSESRQAIERLGFDMPDSVRLKKVNAEPKAGSHVNGIFMPGQRRLDLANIIRHLVPGGMTLEPDGCHLAPNYSTLVALRALCVLSADTSKQKEELEQNANSNSNTNAFKPKTEIEIKAEKIELENPTEIPIKQEIKVEDEIASSSTKAHNNITQPTVLQKKLSVEELNSTPAINRFRQRFRALFYKAAGLSRLPPTSVPIKDIAETTLSSTRNNSSIKVEQIASAPMSTPAAIPTARAPTTRIQTEFKQEPELNVDESSTFFDIVVKKENDLDNETERCKEFIGNKI